MKIEATSVGCGHRLCLLLFAFIANLLPIHLSAIPSSISDDYHLFWEDEFEGTELNPMDWKITEGPRKGAVNVSDTIEVSDGYLSISTYTADNQPGNLNDVHHTGFVSTANKLLHPFGYYEARVRMDAVESGAWHAFWLMPGGTTPNWGDFPDASTGAEVDIFEYRHSRKKWRNNDIVIDMIDKIHYGILWNGYWGQKQKADNPVVDPLDGSSLVDGQFHNYGVLITPDKYEFYFDGEKLWETTEGVTYAYSHVLLTSEVTEAGDEKQGWFANHAPDEGYGVKGASTNPKFTIDWVRIYDLNDSESGQMAYSSNGVPGGIEAENFDQGGLGVGYYDKSDSGPGNNTSYRSGEGVDIDASASASNGYYVTEPTENEWMEYTLNPTKDGIYSVEVSVARIQDTTDNKDNGMMLFYADGEELGEIRIDDTSGWTAWNRQSIPSYIYLSGQPVFTIRFANRRKVNLDQLHFQYLGNVYDFREAEDGSSNLSILNTEFASGGSYLSGFGDVGTPEYVAFNGVDGFTDGGDVTMTVRYAWPQGHPDKLPAIRVIVNGEYLQADGSYDTDPTEAFVLPMTNTYSWHMYHELSLTVPGLLAGTNNTVMLESDGLSNQNIRLDSVLFSKEEAVSSGSFLSIEAEAPGNSLLGNAGNDAYVGTNSNAQGGAYVSGFNKSNAGVEWPDLAWNGAGMATVTIHYSNGSGVDVTKALEVNGVAQDVVFPVTSDWNDYSGTVEVSVSLLGDGTDDLRIWRKYNTAGDEGNLRVDFIEIGSVSSLSIFEEAEGNEFGQAIVGTHPSSSGGEYVDRLNKTASGVEWTGISAPADMQATLTFGYANGSGSDSLKMLVVNGQSQLVSFPVTSGWNDYTGEFTITVDLVEGDNTIRLWRDGSGIDTLRVDYMELTN